MRVTLFDYDAGNLHSLAKALRGEGRDGRLETDARAALQTDVLGVQFHPEKSSTPGLAFIREYLNLVSNP